MAGCAQVISGMVDRQQGAKSSRSTHKLGGRTIESKHRYQLNQRRQQCQLFRAFNRRADCKQMQLYQVGDVALSGCGAKVNRRFGRAKRDELLGAHAALWSVPPPSRHDRTGGSTSSVGAAGQGKSMATAKAIGQLVYSKYVPFGEPFTADPQVTTALTAIDASNASNLRVLVLPMRISRQGFDLRVQTWGDTKLHFVQVTWTAFQQGL